MCSPSSSSSSGPKKIVGVPDPIRYKDRIVGVVMYRDNTIIDVVRQIDEDE